MDINSLDARTAMALSASFTSAAFDNVHDEVEALRSYDISTLVSIVEHPSAASCQRFAAGSLLAFLGDPRINTLSPCMINIPAGEVFLGLEESDVDYVVNDFSHIGVLQDWIIKECPRYGVRLTTYNISKYCVTNKEYYDFLCDTEYESIPTSWQFGKFPLHLSNHPVYTIRPQDADEYCAWLSIKTGRTFRLPTEAEWEFAAGQGIRDNVFPWGKHYQHDHANTIEENVLSTTPVGMYPRGASPFGLMDMAGNVEEYTSSNYEPYPGGKFICDDLYHSEGNYRVARGGSFTRFRDLSRVTRRHGWYKKDFYCMGFRLAEDVLL